MSTILIATRNKHKVQEIRGILGNEHLFRTLDEFPNAPAITEDAPDFAGNAVKKAVGLAKWLAQQTHQIDFVLADDSGLEVDALNGAPGVYSARFAGLDTGASGNSADAANNAKLLKLVKDIPLEKRTARFKCVIALTPVPRQESTASSAVCYADESELATETFEGACDGKIIDSPRGENGFGYDPLFVPDGFNQTFAELGESTKNNISHRARALTKLKLRLETFSK